LERLKRRARETEQALQTLTQILKEPYSTIVRDATIQRFEYTFESFWKFLREYLREHEGLICNSPKSCFREALSVGLLAEEQAMACLQMSDDRNLTSHTYIESLAEQIFHRIRDHHKLMLEVFDFIKRKIEG